MQDKLIIIATWESENSTSIRLQDFISEEGHFIPIFSNAETFKQQVQGSGFEHQGVEIDRAFLCSILNGTERLILNPGGANPLKMTKADLMAGHPDISE